MAVVESAVLAEMGAAGLVDVLVRVEAPRELRLARLQARDGLAPSEAEARLQAHERLALGETPADHVIVNDGSAACLRERVAQCWQTLGLPS